MKISKQYHLLFVFIYSYNYLILKFSIASLLISLGSSKVGLTPIPLMKKEDISKVFDSMKKQRKLINDPFFNASKVFCVWFNVFKADGWLDPIIQAYELGFIKQRKRSVINLKLHQIKESTRRSEAIQSVLEYTLKSGKDHITNDLKQLEKEIRVNKVEKSLFEGMIHLKFSNFYFYAFYHNFL